MEIDKTKKFILDACCSVRGMWDKTNKKHPNTIYIDLRKEPKGFISHKPNYSIEPDFVMDYRKMDFSDNSFKLVYFDPPHLKNSGRAIFRKQYGESLKSGWEDDLKKGFDECWRVLEDYGVLVFKWSDHDIKAEEVLEIIGRRPLVRNIQSGSGKTKSYWFSFMKIPEGK